MMTTTNLDKYRSHNKIQQYLIKRFFDNIFQILKPFKITKALDIGCGEGYFAHKLHQEFPNINLHGMDISKRALGYFKKNNPKLKIVNGSVYKMPFRNSSFELAFCLEVLEHLEKPEIALLEIKRVIKKYAILSVPLEPYYRLTNLFRAKYIKNLGNHPEHVQNWNKNSFLKLIKQYFKIIKYKKSFPWQIVLITKRIGEK